MEQPLHAYFDRLQGWCKGRLRDCVAMQVLRGPQKLPTPQAAAYKSMPEAQMVGRRIALAEVGSRSRCLICNALLLI